MGLLLTYSLQGTDFLLTSLWFIR